MNKSIAKFNKAPLLSQSYIWMKLALKFALEQNEADQYHLACGKVVVARIPATDLPSFALVQLYLRSFGH